MLGTFLNMAGILGGGVAGLCLRRPLATSTQRYLKMVLGVYTVWIGLRLAVTSLHGGVGSVFKQLAVAVLALFLGRAVGRVLGIQRGLNQLGRMAGAKLSSSVPPGQRAASEGFLTATILFCAAPLAVLGPIPDGLVRDYQPLLLKAAMDGLVALSLVPHFRWPVMLGIVPMAALQSSVSRLAEWAEPTLRIYSLMDSVNLVDGLLIFCLGLIIFALRRVAVGDYLPALVIAPWLSWLAR
jgi:uncharacterized protein